MQFSSGCQDVPGVGRFVHQLTHDLRNDLAAVEVFAATALDLVPEGLAKEALREISSTVAACGRRLSALRAAACYEPEEVRLVQMSPEAWATGIRAHLKRHACGSCVSFSDMGLADGVVRADPAMVAAILDELLANASRYGGRGGDEREIAFRLAVVGDALQVRVRQPIRDARARVDIGHGVGSRIHEPFLSATRHHYGFGLSVAAQRASRMGGALSVQIDGTEGETPFFEAVLELPFVG